MINNLNVFDYDFTYFEAAEETQYVYNKIHEDIKNNLDNLQTDYQKAHFAYKWVLDNANVDYTMSNLSSYNGIAGDGTACQGYSTLYATIANELGLDCQIVFGGVNGSSTNHAWNIVKLNNNWYCVDTTWGDILNSDKYFLVTKDVLSTGEYGYHVASMYNNFENVGEVFATESYDASNEQKINYVLPSVYDINMDVLKSNILDIGEGYTLMISNPNNIKIMFRSDNPSVAQVDGNGVITGISAGNATIIAYNKTLNFSQSCGITVTPKKTNIKLSSNNIKLKTKDSLKLKVNNALNYSKFNWSSSNESVVKVSKLGTITGVTPGNSIVICTITNGTSVIVLKCNINIIK